LLLVSATQVALASIGQIADLKGNSEVVRKTAKFDGKLALPIEQLDNVQTGNGRVEIKFVDDSTVKITEHSKLIIDDFVYSGKPDSSKMALKFAAGTVRFATGQTGKMDKQNINLQTPSATIAVRGTDFATTVDDFGKSLIILLPEEDGSVGEITVSNNAGMVVLSRAFQATTVSTMDNRPSAPVLLNLTLKEIDNMLIVSPPKEAKTETREAETRNNILDLSELDIDYLKQDDLKEDPFANTSDLDINAINNDYLATDALTVALGDICTTKDNVKLCGTRFGLDPTTQLTAILSGDYIRIVKTVNSVVDFTFKKDVGKTLSIDSNGKSYLIELNEPAGGTKIFVKQSD
jgi:hypothetical protein